MIGKIRLLARYIRDKNTSLLKKLLILGSILYLILPFDLVPDFVIGLGWLDDILVGVFIWLAVKSELNEYNKVKHRSDKKASKVIKFRQKQEDNRK